MEERAWTHGRSYLAVDSPMFFHCLKRYLTLFFPVLQAKAPKVLWSLRGHAPKPGSRGPPLVEAVHATQPEPRRTGEGWRREEGNPALRCVPFLSPPHQETPTATSACSSGAGVCPLTTSSPHWSSKVTSRRARILPRPRCRVRTCVGR